MIAFGRSSDHDHATKYGNGSHKVCPFDRFVVEACCVPKQRSVLQAPSLTNSYSACGVGCDTELA